jgi:hypothetical protein
MHQIAIEEALKSVPEDERPHPKVGGPGPQLADFGEFAFALDLTEDEANL